MMIPPLQIDSIGKSFQSGQVTLEVLKSVNLSVAAGESVSIQGQSGSGKTTLLNCIAGIEVPDSGNVFWEGKALSDLSPAEQLRLRGTFMGFIFQAFYLIPELDVVNNILLPARILKRRMKDARAEAMDLLQHFKLENRCHSSILELSGGERQRIAIARALINQPKLILADEPTGNLDETTADEVIEQLLDLVKQRQTALVLVTHSKRFASKASKQLRLTDGELQ